MKICFNIVILFISFLIILLLFIHLTVHLIEFTGRKMVPEMTPDKARKLFQTVGGIGVINREASVLFDQMTSNEWRFLSSGDLSHCPAISSLYSTCEKYSGEEYSGTSIAIDPENGRHIEIKFGNHWSLKRIYIFDPNGTVKIDSSSNWFQVASNIFVSK